MRKPLPAPELDFSKLLGSADSISALLATGPNPISDDFYLHWDKLRHYPLPASAESHENWWAAIKFRRRANYSPVPLLDKQGKPFVWLRKDSIDRILHEIDMNLGGAMREPSELLEPDDRDRYLINSLIDESITSSQMEGAATTRQVARDLLRSGRRPVTHGEKMIFNNFIAMQKVLELKEKPLSRELIFDLHRTVTEGTLKSPGAAGRFRKEALDGDICVVDSISGETFHRPPDENELPERLEQMCRFANGETPGNYIHPVIRSIILHFWLAYDHPFVDGNGRMARTLFYWAMLRHGYWLFEFVSISPIIRRSRGQYERAFLYTETDDNDLTYFILYHLRAIELSMKEMRQYIQKKRDETNRLQDRLKGIRDLNHRQKALVIHALKHPGHGYTTLSHQRSHGVAPQTARNDLADLERRGYLQRRKIGKALHFFAVTELDRSLQKA